MQASTESSNKTARGKYTRLRQIGSGSFGKVFTIKDDHSGQTFVSKKIDLNFVDVGSPAANPHPTVFGSQDPGGAGPPQYHQAEGVLQDGVQHAGPHPRVLFGRRPERLHREPGLRLPAGGGGDQ